MLTNAAGEALAGPAREGVMYAGTTTRSVRTPFETSKAEATRLSYKAYARRKWRNRLLRLVLWGAVLALAIAILVMVGS